jgi:glycosyltransferase involved in cell wall biosynthesis
MTRKIGLFLNASPSQGGTFQYCQSVLDAVAAMPSSDYRKLVVYTHDGWLEYLKDHDLDLLPLFLGKWKNVHGKVTSSFLPMALWRSHLARIHPVARFLARHNCNLWVFPAQDTWTYLTSVPSLAVVHDLMHRYERRFPEVGCEYRIRETHYRNLCRWSQGVLVDSRVGREHLVQSYGLDASRIHILPFVPPRYIFIHSGESGDRLHYDLPRKFFFYPAQFWEHKNHKGIVLAVSKLWKEIPDLKVVLVGYRKNGYGSTLKLIEDLRLTDRFLHFDYVPESHMVSFYKLARALVMPTFFGPTNIPPLEAMVLGTPVAVSDIYGMREQLGDAALYFDPSSVESIAVTLRALWTDDRLCDELRTKGLLRSAQWTPENFNRRFRQIIDDVLAGGVS